MLDEVDAQHALQSNGRTPIAGLGVVRCDFFAQRRPGHQRIHGLEEFVAPRRLTVLFKAQLRVGCHSKGLLLHGPVIYPGWSSSGDFFSVALNLPRQPTKPRGRHEERTVGGWGGRSCRCSLVAPCHIHGMNVAAGRATIAVRPASWALWGWRR